jgi:hypothetical protein
VEDRAPIRAAVVGVEELNQHEQHERERHHLFERPAPFEEDDEQDDVDQAGPQSRDQQHCDYGA